MHAGDVVTYWTSAGGGAAPVAGNDKIGGNIVIVGEAAPNATTFMVTHSGDQVDGHQVRNPVFPTGLQEFAWSIPSDVYHFARCVFVANMSPQNLNIGTSPPSGKRLHLGCPR